MANALGKLFGDIAEAIRAKTGEEGTMKPAEFPAKIAEIEVGGGSDESGEPDYNLALAEALMIRQAEYYSGDSTTLSMKGFKLSNGGTLGNLVPYSFAGFDDVENMVFTDSLIFEPYVFAGNRSLKILDVTAATASGVAFYQQALNGCTALQSVIVRNGVAGLNNVIFQNISVGYDIEDEGTGANNTFYVYIPAEFYDAIVEKVDANTSAAVPSSRYRKLEDYPEVDKWNETSTVRFWAGDTLLKTEKVRYGKSSSYTYAPYGQKFVEWNPAPTNVTEDMDCYVTYVPSTLAEASWEQINMLSSMGRICEFYGIGSEKDVTLTYADGTTETITMVLETDADILLADESSYAKSTFLAKNALKQTRQMHSSSGMMWGQNSSLLKWMNGELFAVLPSDLQSVIKEKHTSSLVGWGMPNAAKCWIPSAKEVQLKLSSGTLSENGVPFPRYTTNNIRKKKLGNDGADTSYWVRSYCSSGSTTYCAYVSTDGSYVSASAYSNNSSAVVVGFCI